MAKYRIQKFPRSRIATIDVGAISLTKHRVTAMIEVDVSESREKIKKYKKEVGRISFLAWLIKVISMTVKENELVAAYLKGKRNAFIFSDVNISLVVEKEINGQKVPIPLVIENASEKSMEKITGEINEAKNKKLSDKDIVLQKKADKWERLYYHMPGFMRRSVWRYMLKHPQFAFGKMGNVAVTSIGMKGNVKGWFIPFSVHPVCFGIGNINKKPVVIDDLIEIREMMSMTILLDHDVIDGSPMARFISDLTANIEGGAGLI